MNVALVHDYLHEFGGAERVLLALSEIWPNAPIYTAFYTKESSAWKRFKDHDLRPSWFHRVPYSYRLASPLRFLAPLIWKQFNFSNYDLVITSANWYITKGVRKGSGTVEICYCHTPPRYLYGYATSVEWRRYLLVRVYGEVVSHFLRIADFEAAQRVDHFISNSHNVAGRIEKFYRRDSTVIHPPVDVPNNLGVTPAQDKEDYYVVVSRLVGGKGLELAIAASNILDIRLKVVGKPAGWGSTRKRLQFESGSNVEFLGEVSDEELWRLYARARAFLATAEDEDFGITPVEAQACGTPVIAYRGGGYLETVLEGKTGLFFNEHSPESLASTIRKLERSDFSSTDCQTNAERFSKQRFQQQIRDFVEGVFS